jgi:glucose dehydrogenase
VNLQRVALFGIGAIAAVLASTPLPRGQAQRPGAATSVNWPLHNLDLAGGRFSSLDQINTSNVKSLSPRWLFQHGVIDGVSNQTTPVIVDGIMYVTDARGSVYAVDAADGHLLWTHDVTSLIGGGAKEGYVFRNRGVCMRTA